MNLLGGRNLFRRAATQTVVAAQNKCIFNSSSLAVLSQEFKQMDELDENGWGHVHHAAFRGFAKSIERFVKADEKQLELPTNDELMSTPLLLAVMSGVLDTVKCMVELGARLEEKNTQNHGIVELACMRHSLHLLRYYDAYLPPARVPLWKQMVRMLAGLSDDEIEHAGACFRALLSTPEKGSVESYAASALEAGIVPVLVKVIKGDASEEAKTQSFLTLTNLNHLPEARRQFSAAGGLAALVTLLKATAPRLVQLAARTMGEICQGRPEDQDTAVKVGAIPALVRVTMLETLAGASLSADVLTDIVKTLGIICEGNEAFQMAASREQGCFQRLAFLYENCAHKGLLLALTRAVGKLCQSNPETQQALLTEKVAQPIIFLTHIKAPDLQLSAVETLSLLAEKNKVSQRMLREAGAVVPLLGLLKVTRKVEMQEYAAGALWAIAGFDAVERTAMATGMGVQLFIEFIGSSSSKLHLIGSDGLSVLAQGPLGQQDLIGQKNGIMGLVRMLKSDSEQTVICSLQALRHLCTNVGSVPHAKNQSLILVSRGLRILVALMVHAKNEMIRVEATLTLATCSQGNPEVVKELQANLEFNYVRILKMLYSSQATVRLQALTALATFAYNNLSQQRDIAAQGGIRFACVLPFLRSSDELQRCQAAFQVVVLSRIIPDEEQAISSAAGIKILMDLLNDAKEPEVISLAGDYVARLSHTRAGVPQALVSIGVVPILCRHMLSGIDSVRGCAAIAISYLSYNPHARRQILKECRQDPFLMEVLNFYSKHCSLDPILMEGWAHYKRVGLPPIKPGKPPLSASPSTTYKDPSGRQLTLTALEDETSIPGQGAGNGSFATTVQLPKRTQPGSPTGSDDDDVLPEALLVEGSAASEEGDEGSEEREQSNNGQTEENEDN